MKKIKLSEPVMAIDSEMRKKVLETLGSGMYVMGEETRKFEEEFSRHCGTESSVAVSSGTAAIHLALSALGIKPGDEVITTTHSFIATANAIVHAGGTPVLVDIEPDTHNIDPEKIEEKITKKTKCIMPVHIYGHPADMDPIMEIAEKHDLLVFEDACQANGAKYKGKTVGSIGDAAAFSFYPAKVMSVCSDGGMVTAKREGVTEKVSMLRNQGRAPGKKYEHDIIGYNFRTSEIASSIGRLQLKRLPEWIEKRRKLASLYDRLLKGAVEVPVEKSYAKAVYYVYTVSAENRDGLREHLGENGVESGIYYPVPIHLQVAYEGYGFGRFPVAERAAEMILSLPMHPYLGVNEVKYVAGAVSDFYEKKSK